MHAATEKRTDEEATNKKITKQPLFELLPF